MQPNSVGAVLFYTFSSLSEFDWLTHAVSTRQGGVSMPPFASLNLTWTSGDEPQAVEENHRRLFAAVGVSRDTMVSPRQIHGDHVRSVGGQDRGSFIAGCDALITDHAEVTLLLRYADCVPLLLFDPHRGAIGVAHAGWRGTLAGIAQATVRSMAQSFGCRPGDLVAGIGPAIGPCCYEIGPDVAAQVEAVFGPGADLLRTTSKWTEPGTRQRATAPPIPLDTPAADQSQGQSIHFDLWAANELQLRAAGVPNVEVAGLCTACHREEFFSYRAENGRTGHHAALLCLRE